MIATTEAPSYRRVAVQRMRAEGLTGEEIKRSQVARGFGIRDGNGIVFVSSTGEICPAGFLPQVQRQCSNGSARRTCTGMVLYSKCCMTPARSGALRRLRVSRSLRRIEGRAYQATGDSLASDPLCQFTPQRMTQRSTELNPSRDTWRNCPSTRMPCHPDHGMHRMKFSPLPPSCGVRP